MKDYYLKLNENPVLFNPTGDVTNIFFDDSNCQVFAVRSSGETGVVVSGPSQHQKKTFCLRDKGSIISIKFSPNHSILGVQRSDVSIDFANFHNGKMESLDYSHKCKGRSNQILNFYWLSNNEIVFVTKQGLEVYQIKPEKRILKMFKHFPCSISWSLYLVQSHIVIVSTSSSSSTFIVPFQFKDGNLYKMSKLEVENHSMRDKKLQERDVIVVCLYDKNYIGIIRHPKHSSIEDCKLDLYLINKDLAMRKSHVLQLTKDGKFAFNVVDNMIIAHHQPSKTSLAFDIKLPGIIISNVVHIKPLLPPSRIKPFTLERSESSENPAAEQRQCVLYANNWVVFQPNIIIDARVGCMWRLKSDLTDVFHIIKDQGLVLDFLLHRTSSKSIIVLLCLSALKQKTSFSQISMLFSKLNQVYKDFIDACNSNQEVMTKPDVFLSQKDMFSLIFENFLNDEKQSFNYKSSILLEYIRSLESFKIEVQHFIHEAILNLLIKHQSFFLLEQLFNHHIITDSIEIANLLLANQQHFPHGYNISIKMLKRLAVADLEIMKLMLERKHVLQALRFIRSIGMIDLVPAAPFLEASIHDNTLFYSTYKFFEARNIVIRGNPEFVPSQNCDQYMLHYIENFSSDIMENL